MQGFVCYVDLAFTVDLGALQKYHVHPTFLLECHLQGLGLTAYHGLYDRLGPRVK